MIWGRLGYDPTLGNERFVKILQQRYPTAPGADLFTAWQEASMIYPKATGFHWGALDFQWYIESSQSTPGYAKTPSGFHDVNRFITLPPHKGTDNISIPDYVKATAAGETLSGTTPIEVSQEIHAHADRALAILGRLSHGGDKELRHTLDDIRTIAYLGKYYAHKIRGATELALFRETKKRANQGTAVTELTEAAHFWRLYASTALGQYQNPLWTNRVGHVDWRQLYEEVLDDVAIARGGGIPRVASISPTPGGVILEAESALSRDAGKVIEGRGHPGVFVAFKPAMAESWIEWTFDAPQAGTYVLEVQYIAYEGQNPAALAINGKDAGEIILWRTGDERTAAWDRKTVTLEAGTNTLKLTPTGRAWIDHLNVLYAGPASRP